MPKRMMIFSLVLLLGSLAGLAKEPVAGPNENSLLSAWEAALQAEDSTEVFQRTADKTYRYKTRLFPFDGELKVLNVLIQDFGDEAYAPGFASGSVEVELVGFSQEQMTRYARSYAYWYQLHSLFFDLEEGRWLKAKEYRVVAMARNPLPGGSPFMAWLAQNYFIVIMALLAMFLWWLSKKSGRQVKTAMAHQDEAMELTRRSFALSEQALRLNEEANGVLKEILQELKDRK